RAPTAGHFGGVDEDARTRHGPSSVGGEHTTRDAPLRRRRRLGRWLKSRCVAGRLLLASLLGLGGKDDRGENRGRERAEEDVLSADYQTWASAGLDRHFTATVCWLWALDSRLWAQPKA